jgi:hypothetical protein
MEYPKLNMTNKEWILFLVCNGLISNKIQKKIYKKHWLNFGQRLSVKKKSHKTF